MAGASDVAVSEGVIKVFNDMKIHKSSGPEEVKKRKKVVLFCLSEDKKSIILEEGEEALGAEAGQTVVEAYTTFVTVLPDSGMQPRRASERTNLLLSSGPSECTP